ncbi:hypothetical protein SI65_00683 [Aspergillus cristatus]|uniref:Uncharacterized protein n=1 Tax=Aspergillus cristatus TaxID=573508 RepID=A0A1E3BQ40_ASPCR|nr:hypothetical protein SI65_00683 [Aspergillus cristatus]
MRLPFFKSSQNAMRRPYSTNSQSTMVPGPGTLAPPNTPYPSRTPTAQSCSAPPNSPEPTHVKPGKRSLKEPFPDLDDEQLNYNPSADAIPSSPLRNHETSTDAVSAAQTELGQDFNYDSEKGIPRGHSLKRRGRSGLCDDKERRCACWRRLSKKARLAIKIVIAIVILGAMLAIALGIAAAAGGVEVRIGK